MSIYESAVQGRREFREAYRRERAENERLRNVLRQLRVKAIPAGAASVRGNEDRVQRVNEVLDLIDDALGDFQ